MPRVSTNCSTGTRTTRTSPLAAKRTPILPKGVTTRPEWLATYPLDSKSVRTLKALDFLHAFEGPFSAIEYIFLTNCWAFDKVYYQGGQRFICVHEFPLCKEFEERIKESAERAGARRYNPLRSS